MLPFTRSLLWVTSAAVVTAGLTACNNETRGDNVTTVSGNCALDKDNHRLSPLSEETLEKTLGQGTYRLSGDVSGAGTTSDPTNGTCTYDSVGDDGKVTRRLTLSVKGKNQPYSDYAKQQQTLEQGGGITKIADGRGYVRVEKGSAAYDGGTGESGVGVIVSDVAVYGATLLVPDSGIDGAQACETLVRAAADALAKPVPSA